MTRRSALEVRLDIMMAIENGKHLITHIFYESNISWTGIQRHIKYLIEANCIEHRGREYYLTDNGFAVLHHWRTLKRELP